MTRLMGREKQRISERIEHLDAERKELSGQLNELETAERVVERFGGKAGTTGKRGRARPAAQTAPAAGEKRIQGIIDGKNNQTGANDPQEDAARRIAAGKEV